MKNSNINIEDKLDEFIGLLKQSDLDNREVKAIKSKINAALDKKLNKKNAIEEIKSVSLLDIDDLEKLDKLEFLLNTNLIDSKDSKKSYLSEVALKIVKIVVGILMITLGFAMVVMPTSHAFEMFTIFWFNPNDGITLMDIISLIIIGVGTYVLIKAFTKLTT